MNSSLFALDPMASISYAQYNAVKKDEGSFEDFLLHYDSHGANNGKNDWLFKLMGKENGLQALMKNPELIGSIDLNQFDFGSKISTSNFFDSKIELLKLQALFKGEN